MTVMVPEGNEKVDDKYIEESKTFYDMSSYNEWLSPFRDTTPKQDGAALSDYLSKISIYLQGMRASLEFMPESYADSYHKIMEKVFNVLYDFFNKASVWKSEGKHLSSLTYETSDGFIVDLCLSVTRIIFSDVDAQDRQLQNALSLLIGGNFDSDFETLRVLAGEIHDNYYLYPKHQQGQVHFSETWLAISYTPDDLKGLFVKYFVSLPDKETNDQLLYVYEQLSHGIAILIVTTETAEAKDFIDLISNNFIDRHDLVRIIAEEMRYHTAYYQQNILIRNMLYSGDVIDRKIASGYMLELVATSEDNLMMLMNMGGEGSQELFKDYILVMTTLQQQLLSFQFRLSVVNRKHRDLVFDYYESISDTIDKDDQNDRND